jgi:hypothetical protein
MTIRNFIDRILPQSAVPLDFHPESAARGFPANVGHETAPHEAEIARIGQQYAEAHVLAATGAALDADLVVSGGHAHDTVDGLLAWRQVGSWRFLGDLDSSNREGYVCDQTALADIAAFDFRMPLSGDGLSALVDFVIPRLRCSVPAAGAAAPVALYVTGVVSYVGAGSAYVTSAVMSRFVVAALAGSTFADAWIEGPPIQIPRADQVTAGGDFSVILAAQIDAGGHKATLWEFQLGFFWGG